MKEHIPVLLQETLNFLSVKPNDTVLDGTLGLGGHAKEIISKLENGIFVGIDSDSEALSIAKKHISKHKKNKTKLFIYEDNYRNIKAITEKSDIPPLNAVLLDLGWGSHHLTSGRGFSFSEESLLDMCYSTKDNGCKLKAYEIINTADKDHLKQIIRDYGEERWALSIARNIVEARKTTKLVTAKQLADVIAKSIPKKFHPTKIHPATKTFQALRIAVNDELGALKEFLVNIPSLCAPSARIAILSFHSLEDRIVKQTFREWEEIGKGKRVNKKPITPKYEETSRNPRARSAKLRTFITNPYANTEK